MNVPETDMYKSKLTDAEELLTKIAEAINRDVQNESKTAVALTFYRLPLLKHIGSKQIGSMAGAEVIDH